MYLTLKSWSRARIFMTIHMIGLTSLESWQWHIPGENDISDQYYNKLKQNKRINTIETMSYKRYLCLVAHSGLQQILCCGFVFALCPILPVSLDCLFLIAPSVFSDVYLGTDHLTWRGVMVFCFVQNVFFRQHES